MKKSFTTIYIYVLSFLILAYIKNPVHVFVHMLDTFKTPLIQVCSLLLTAERDAAYAS
jgi:hypothetical protein